MRFTTNHLTISDDFFAFAEWLKADDSFEYLPGLSWRHDRAAFEHEDGIFYLQLERDGSATAAFEFAPGQPSAFGAVRLADSEFDFATAIDDGLF